MSDAHHVITLALTVSPREARIIDQRLEVNGKFRNAVNSVLVHRANAMRNDKEWRQAAGLTGPSRTAAFKALRDRHEFSKYHARMLALDVLRESGWMGDHVPAQTAQTEAAQVYTAANEWLVGKRGVPRPKASRGRDTMWGAGAGSPIRFDYASREMIMGGRLKRKNLRLRATITNSRLAQLLNGGEVMGAAVKREMVRGKNRYFALVRVRGKPYRNPKYLGEVNDGVVVGLDAGPSKLVAVSNGVAVEINRAPQELLERRRDEQKRIRRAQRALDRSRRATNPECFDEKGRYVKGKKIEVRSKAYEATRRKLASEQRRQRVNRRQDETRLAREIMVLGNNVVTEDVDYRSWQASFYGKRMGFTAPGALMARTKREAVLTGGGVTELPLKLALSQHCVCGAVVRKQLEDRAHSCPSCGLVADRDVISAWLCELIKINGVKPSDWITSRGPLVKPADADRLKPQPLVGVGSSTPRDGAVSSTKQALACSSADAVPLPGTPRPVVRGAARREQVTASVKRPARGANAT